MIMPAKLWWGNQLVEKIELEERYACFRVEEGLVVYLVNFEDSHSIISTVEGTDLHLKGEYDSEDKLYALSHHKDRVSILSGNYLESVPLEKRKYVYPVQGSNLLIRFGKKPREEDFRLASRIHKNWWNIFLGFEPNLKRLREYLKTQE